METKMKTEKQVEDRIAILSVRIDTYAIRMIQVGWDNVSQEDKRYYWDLCAELNTLIWVLYGVA
jgi:hypothetical protein